MRNLRPIVVSVVLFACLNGNLSCPVFAGVYYSGESIAEMPAQWRGFLLDHRSLRLLSVPPLVGMPGSPLKQEYLAALATLERKANPSADELADLGAVLIRLGKVDRAVEVLRSAQRMHAQHFRIAANLGTAWHLAGNLDQAVDALRSAVQLAPVKHRPAEELHLRLVQGRRKQANAQTLDDLLGVSWGEHVGPIPAGDRKKLPADAVANMQRLALALPADGRILWQLGELANVFGDVRMAAAIFDGCVTEFGLIAPAYRARRQAMRSAADKLGPVSRTDAARTDHEAHGLAFRSPRPLVRRFDLSRLPEIRADGPNALPWAVLAETTFDARFKPTFVDYLKKLDGKTVTLTGFMQPLADAVDVTDFLLIEYPVGCWFCETPPPNGLLLVELPPGRSIRLQRGMVKVEGLLKLNSTDPEDFLMTLKNANVGAID